MSAGARRFVSGRFAPVRLMALLGAAALLGGCATSSAVPVATSSGVVSSSISSEPSTDAPSSAASSTDAPSTAASTAAPSTSAPSPGATGPYTVTKTTRTMTDGILTDLYVRDLPATLRVPAVQGPAPLVVVVPGGGWGTSDPTDYVPLAEALTAAGSTTSLITYSTIADGAVFPQPVDDVACAIRWSAFQAAALGYPPTKVVVAGHSAGGHLAMLVALSGDHFGGTCSAPPVRIDGVIGMAGVYDTTVGSESILGALNAFFAGTPPDQRATGSPLVWAQNDTAIPSGLHVLLIHGAADPSVPVSQTTTLADALTRDGVPVSVVIIPGADHTGAFIPSNTNSYINAWLENWTPASG